MYLILSLLFVLIPLQEMPAERKKCVIMYFYTSACPGCQEIEPLLKVVPVFSIIYVKPHITEDTEWRSLNGYFSGGGFSVRCVRD